MTPRRAPVAHRQRHARRGRVFGGFARPAYYASARIHRVGPNDAHINLRLPSGLLQALDACAGAVGATRSAMLRALVEDMADTSELPTLPPTRAELLDDELQRLRELSRG